MPLTLGSAKLTDACFLQSLASCELPLADFQHGDHLRFAWLMLERHSFEEARALVEGGIRRFAASHGKAHIFHQTVTTAWVHLLATHREPSFALFLSANEERLNHQLLHRFWTPEVLASRQAREFWVAPDRAPLPAR